MYTTYHLSSADEINADILNAIKSVFKEKPIVLTIEEDEGEFAIAEAQKQFVYNSIKEYREKPELLINEEDAWKMINAG